MTIEERTVIELIDILCFEFECRQCHAKLSVPLSGSNEVPLRCPQCKSEQWLVPNSRDYTDLQFMLNMLHAYRKGEKRPFALRLEIRNSKK